MVSLSRWRDCVWPTSSTSTCSLREISAVLRVLRSACPVAIVSEQVCAYSVIAPCCLILSPSRETWGFPPRNPLLTAHTFTSLRKGAQVSGPSQESICALAAEVPWGWRWRPPFTDFQCWARFPDLYPPSVVCLSLDEGCERERSWQRQRCLLPSWRVPLLLYLGNPAPGVTAGGLGFQVLTENRVSSSAHLGLFPSGISLHVWFKVQKALYLK